MLKYLSKCFKIQFVFFFKNKFFLTRNVTKLLKEFAIEKNASNADKPTIKDLKQMLKKMPQFQKEFNSYALHFTIAEDCFIHFNKNDSKLKQICDVEQNLAMGVDQQGEKIKDPMKLIVPFLFENDVSQEDKTRLIMLYLIYKNGITEENFEKLLSHAMMSDLSIKQNILNLEKLGQQIFSDQNNVGFFLN